jgi:mono/diheme cytochrome c family protein
MYRADLSRFCLLSLCLTLAPACDDAAPALEREAGASLVPEPDASMPRMDAGEDADGREEPDAGELAPASDPTPDANMLLDEQDAASVTDAAQATADAAPPTRDAAPAEDAAAVIEDAAARASYARDVAPILEQHCLACHVSGGQGPFPLTNFGEVVSHDEEIRSVTAERIMPPCEGAGSECGLSDAEIETLGRWVLQGTPR